MLDIAGSVIDQAQTGVGRWRRRPGLVAFNPSSYDRTEVADLPDGTLALVSAPACGWSVFLPDRLSLARRRWRSATAGWTTGSLGWDWTVTAC